MLVHFDGWKLVASAALAALIFASVLAKAPRRSGGTPDPRRLVLGSIGLYAVGASAWIAGHLRLAAILFGLGIGTAALGAWLSRAGQGRERLRRPTLEPPEPPDDSGGHPPFDWDAFERELLDYTARERRPATSRERQPAGRR
jgi:hypothetical protein